MTKEELKAWLKSCLQKRQEAASLERAIRRLEKEKCSPKTSKLDQIGGAGSPGAGGTFERLIFKQDELERLYQQKLADLIEEQLRVEKAIESLDPVERMLMRLHYLDGLTWEEVAVEISYSWRQVHRIHSRALDKLSEEDEEEVTAEEKIQNAGLVDVVLLKDYSYDDALIGVTEDGRAVYDFDKMVAWLVETQGFEELEAIEWIEYNTIRALPYYGPDAPLIIYPL